MSQFQPPLTIIVTTGNAHNVIEDCLQSAQWADELLVVDSYSTDGTLEIARQYTDRILQRPFAAPQEQKNWAVSQARNSWVFILDADERITAELRAEIESALQSNSELVGYRVPRLNYVLGEPLHVAAYFPDYQLRLFRREASRQPSQRVHGKDVFSGPVDTLNAPLIHYAHRTVRQTLNTLLLGWAPLEAAERSNKRLGFNLLFRPFAAFALRYFVRGGWRAGLRGLAVSWLWAMYVASTFIYMWEQSLRLPAEWWKADWNARNSGLQH